MDYRKFGNTYVLRVDRGEEVISSITALCEKENITLGAISGLGAAQEVQMGLYSVPEQKYHLKEFNEPLEITALIGNITRKDGSVYLHVHITVGDKDQHAFGGHLNKCVIGGTAEIFITSYDGTVERELDSRTGTGLNLFKFE